MRPKLNDTRLTPQCGVEFMPSAALDLASFRVKIQNSRVLRASQRRSATPQRNEHQSLNTWQYDSSFEFLNRTTRNYYSIPQSPDPAIQAHITYDSHSTKAVCSSQRPKEGGGGGEHNTSRTTMLACRPEKHSPQP